MATAEYSMPCRMSSTTSSVRDVLRGEGRVSVSNLLCMFPRRGVSAVYSTRCSSSLFTILENCSSAI